MGVAPEKMASALPRIPLVLEVPIDAIAAGGRCRGPIRTPTAARHATLSPARALPFGLTPSEARPFKAHERLIVGVGWAGGRVPRLCGTTGTAADDDRQRRTSAIPPPPPYSAGSRVAPAFGLVSDGGGGLLELENRIGPCNGFLSPALRFPELSNQAMPSATPTVPQRASFIRAPCARVADREAGSEVAELDALPLVMRSASDHE